MLSRGMFMLHDNVPPNSAHVTTALLEKFKWYILDHPPYSPITRAQRFSLVSSPKETSRWEKVRRRC